MNIIYSTLFITLSALPNLSPRSWIGVVDRIEPPWVNIIKETGEEVSLPINYSPSEIKEGDWVIYWTRQRVLNRLDTVYSRNETSSLQELMRALLDRP